MKTLIVRRTCGAISPWLIRLAVALAGLGGATLTRATTVVPPTFDELVNESDYIVRGVVKSVECGSRANASGHGRKIFTKVEVEVREVVAGTPPQKVVLEMLGGRIGNEEMIVEGAPIFKVGEEDVLFISGNGRRMNPLVALMHGRYPIRHETGGREYITRSDGAPLRSEQDVSLPMASSLDDTRKGSAAPLILRSTAPALSPTDFAARIKARVHLTKNRAPREN